jgi:hypothetical protein
MDTCEGCKYLEEDDINLGKAPRRYEELGGIKHRFWCYANPKPYLKNIVPEIAAGKYPTACRFKTTE